jgi:hypothetical protein
MTRVSLRKQTQSKSRSSGRCRFRHPAGVGDPLLPQVRLEAQADFARLQPDSDQRYERSSQPQRHKGTKFPKKDYFVDFVFFVALW